MHHAHEQDRCVILLVIRSGGMIQQIIVRKVSNRGKATDWATVWHWAQDKFPYHTTLNLITNLSSGMRMNLHEKPENA